MPKLNEKNNSGAICHIYVDNLGPIDHCSIDIKKLTVLTGSQASGKSTLAEVVYFCMIAKYIIVNTAETLKDEKLFESSIENLARAFRDMFDGLLFTRDHSAIRCVYASGEWIEISVSRQIDRSDVSVDIALSQIISDRLKGYSYTEENRHEEAAILAGDLNQFMDPDGGVSSMYIPAGRSMITQLLDQIVSYSMNIDPIREARINYFVRAYAQKINSLQPAFKNGFEGALKDIQRINAYKIDNNVVNRMRDLCRKILKGNYIYKAGRDYIQINEDELLMMQSSSSGQQEAAWLINMLMYYGCFYYNTFMVVEEPEGNLYPDAQKWIVEMIALYINRGNRAIITTHSPYVLGAINNLLYAAEVAPCAERDLIIPREEVIPVDEVCSYYLSRTEVKNAVLDGLIDNSLIDGASDTINSVNDDLMGIKLGGMR